MGTDSETWGRVGPPEGQVRRGEGLLVGLKEMWLKASKDWARARGSVEKRQGRYTKGNVYLIASLEGMGLD